MSNLLPQVADLFYRMSPRFYYGLRYYLIRKRWPDFKNPKDLSEYLLGEMLKPEFKKFAYYADKVKVREYVESKGLADILPILYGVWDKAEDIDFSSLPQKFALKTNHGCGNHIICKNKGALDIDKAKVLMGTLVKTHFSIREPHYAFIEPKIYAEELIEYSNGDSLVDYKFMCVKGEIQCILTCGNRSEDFHRVSRCTLNTNWEVLPWITGSTSNFIPYRPKHLDEMSKMAKRLSEDFDFVRVDLYDTGDRVLFGELTFTPNSSLLVNWNDLAIETMAKDLID